MWDRWWRRSRPRPVAGPGSLPSLAAALSELSRLERQRRLSSMSAVWSEAVARAYDRWLQVACSYVGVDHVLDHLDGLDRDLERLRIEDELRAADAARQATAVTVVESDALPAGRPVDPVAIWFIEIAVRLLPPVHRLRYREEFRSELIDVAAPRAHAFRLLSWAWTLRSELRAVRDDDRSDGGDEQN